MAKKTIVKMNPNDHIDNRAPAAPVLSEKKPVEISGQTSQDNALGQDEHLQNHPKFAKFKQGEKQP